MNIARELEALGLTKARALALIDWSKRENGRAGLFGVQSDMRNALINGGYLVSHLALAPDVIERMESERDALIDHARSVITLDWAQALSHLKAANRLHEDSQRKRNGV